MVAHRLSQSGITKFRVALLFQPDTLKTLSPTSSTLLVSWVAAMLSCARRQLADVVESCVTLLCCRVAVHHGEVQQRDGVRGSARAAALCGQRLSQPPHLLVPRQSAHPARRPPLHGNSPLQHLSGHLLGAWSYFSIHLNYPTQTKRKNKTKQTNKKPMITAIAVRCDD